MRHAAEWWAARVAEVGATKGDLETVARRYGVKASTLRWWRTELRRRARTATSPRLLPVVVKAAPPVRTLNANALEVLVEIGATRMTLRGDVSAEHLAVIVTASARSC
jgi:transposase-like protein